MSVSDLQLRNVQLEAELKWAYLKIQMLEEKLRLKRIQQLGPHSETLNDLQLALLTEEEPGVTSDEVAAEAKREPITPPRAVVYDRLTAMQEDIPCKKNPPRVALESLAETH